MLILRITKNLKVSPLTPFLTHTLSLSHLRRFFKSSSKTFSLEQFEEQDQHGTEYSNWVLARSSKHNHDVSFLKRKYGRDRYNIHKLTNMEFMCTLVNRDDKYVLNLNQKIVLLAQMNHICNVLKKEKGNYAQFSTLTTQITSGIQNPDDYICIGTFLNALVDLGDFHQTLWIYVMDALLVKKYDEQYDELFGLYSGLYKYKKSIQDLSDYLQLQKNKVIYNIPIVYRNSLEVVRQYVKFNIYNLKECRILFRCLHNSKINEKYFWRSVNNWFNIYIKQNLERKEFEQFFIVSQSAVDKVLFDDGMIRPRSILQELSEISFILSQHQFISERYVTFIQNLIIYSMDHGSQLFIRFLDIEKQELIKANQQIKLNQHMNVTKEGQEEQINKLEKKYRTVFINPTDLASQSIIHVLIVFKRVMDATSNTPSEKEETQTTENKKSVKNIDNRVLNWLLVRLCQAKMKYTVNELLKIVQCRDFLTHFKIDIRSLILEKIKDVRSKHCSLQNIKDILLFLPLLQYESISYILEDFLMKAHPKDILELTQLFERESMSPEDYEDLGVDAVLHREQQSQTETKIDRSHLRPKQKNKRWMPYLTNYFLKLPFSVNYHQNYYSFEQNCYFLYILLKNEEYWQKKIGYEYMGQMQKLKHSIKITSYSRGFKLQMGTYFYKLMNYIDVVAFFDGG